MRSRRDCHAWARFPAGCAGRWHVGASGSTEAAVDIARIAGLNPSGVICEIMNEDGTMARLPELATFAREHRLKLGSIADLVAYRRRTEMPA
jgi:3,4-dihydroxy-2-butanone 4-phosphate synthase